MKDWIILKNRYIGKTPILEHICMCEAGYHSPYICRQRGDTWICSHCGKYAPPEIADAAMLAGCMGDFSNVPDEHSISRGAEEIYVSK